MSAPISFCGIKVTMDSYSSLWSFISLSSFVGGRVPLAGLLEARSLQSHPQSPRSCGHLVIRPLSLVRQTRLEVLPLAAEQFQLPPVLQLRPDLLFGHSVQFDIPA